MVKVLATGPKVRGFKRGRDDGFLRALKVRSTLSFGWEVKSEAPCRKILRHVKNRLQVWNKILCNTKFSYLSPIPPAFYQMNLLVGLSGNSGGRICFTPSVSSTTFLNARISPGGWRICPLVAAFQTRSLTPLTRSSSVLFRCKKGKYWPADINDWRTKCSYILYSAPLNVF
jgi:hypothetical protein